MRRNSIAALAAIALLATGTQFARADDNATSDQYPRRLFAEKFLPQGKSYACFVRRYDAAHMAARKLQKVTVMKLLVTAEMVPEDKALNYSFRLGLNFRDRRGNFDSSGNCGHPSAFEMSADKMHLGCGVDCDGGGISVELAHADNSTLIRLESIRIWQNNKPDDEGFALEGGADDRVFRLDRADLEDCRSLVADRKELAAMRHK
ncbi:MAG TPA: hypothetical protein VEJ40_07115 [Pseudolabrys sp.]|nr:hypothetical protein [Pseudolabrys sp.]